MELIDRRVAEYLDGLVPARPQRMVAMERHAAEIGFPIIGPAAGQLCYTIARVTGARRIFELGSGFGYSTAWFARAVRENGGGTVHHVVWDADLSGQAREHLAALALDDLIEFHIGEAVQVLSAVDAEGGFDLVFNDIDKEGYPAALDAIERKLRPGGVLITDNLLWHGRVMDEGDHSPATVGVRELTRRVMDGTRWTATIVPIRDGLLVARLNDVGDEA